MTEVATDVFADGFSIDGFSSFVEDGAIGMIAGFVSDSRGIMSGLTGSGSWPYGVLSTAERLPGSVSSLLRLPRNIPRQGLGNVSGVSVPGQRPGSAPQSSTSPPGLGGPAH